MISILFPLVLRPIDIDHFLLSASDGDLDRFAGKVPAACTLEAACLFACADLHWQKQQTALGISFATECASASPALFAMKRFFERGTNVAPAEIFSAPQLDFWIVRSRDNLSSLAWDQFADRFRRSLVQRQFSSTLASALSKAMAELADNVVEHSAAAGDRCRGLVAFHVEDHWLSLVVADVGRGVLATLRENPAHTSLKLSSEALEAAVMRGATSRRDGSLGTGFSTARKAIASLNGRLRFRSGDSALTLDGSNGVLDVRSATVPPLVGLQSCLRIALKGRTIPDLPMPLDSLS